MSEWDEIRGRTPNLALAKKLTVGVWIVSVIVFLLVGMMRRVTIEVGADLTMLPPLHAVLNSIAALCLIGALVAIKGKRIRLHRKLVHGALLCSGLFLISYVVYHFTSGETKFADGNGDGRVDAEELAQVGSMRAVYLVLLLSHIALAALSLPFILLTWVYGFTGQFEKHRKLARRVFPVWLFVAITGPLCYLMLRPYY